MKYLKTFEIYQKADVDKIKDIENFIKQDGDLENLNLHIINKNYEVKILDIFVGDQDEIEQHGGEVITYFQEKDMTEEEYDSWFSELDTVAIDDLDTGIIDAIHIYILEKISPLTFEEYYSGKDMGLL